MRGLTGAAVPLRLSNGPPHLADGLIGYSQRTASITPQSAAAAANKPSSSAHNYNHHTNNNHSGGGGIFAASVTHSAGGGGGNLENGHYGACGDRYDSSAPQSSSPASSSVAAYLPADKVEKIPLVQQWSPSSGVRSSFTRHIGKSMSLDAPVSIAHV